MDFKSNYSKYHRLKLNCNIKSQFKIKRFMIGSGGSSNLIIDVRTRSNDAIIIKMIPSYIYFNVKTKPDYDQLEIKFYQFFTSKYLLTNRTPHIVGIYNHQNCSKIGTFIKNIKPAKSKCPTIEDRLTKKIKYNPVNTLLCDLMLRYEMKLLNSAFDIILLEHCPMELSKSIKWHMNEIATSRGKYILESIDNFIDDLERMFFQQIFTLAIIKDDYPGFLHGDFFVRNILLSAETEYNDADYVAYHYNQKIFYLEANGIYSKMNDFGWTIIENELESSTYKFDKKFHKLYNRNAFNEKTDIFNFFHDIYAGQNLGTESIMKLASDYKIPQSKITPIRDFVAKFFKVNVIDRINKNNNFQLNQTWFIDKIKILEATVKTPAQYLLGDYFRHLQILPEGATIVRHFNAP